LELEEEGKGNIEYYPCHQTKKVSMNKLGPTLSNPNTQTPTILFIN
jgi:Zn-finger protein